MTPSKEITQDQLEEIESQIDRINKEFNQALARIPKGVPVRVGDQFVADKKGRLVAYFPITEQS